MLYIIAQFVYLGVQWLLSMLIARITGFADAGVFSLSMTVSNVSYVIMSCGGRSFQVSDVKNKYTHKEYVCFRTVCSAAGIAMTAAYVFAFGYDPVNTAAIFMYVLFKLFESISDVFYGIMQNEDMLYKGGISMILKGISCFALFMAVYLPTKNLCLGMLAMAAAAGAVTFTFDYLSVRRFISGNRMRADTAVKMLKDCFVIMATAVIINFVIAFPRIILEKLYSKELFGYFSSVFTPTVAISTFMSCVLLIIMKKFAELYFNNEKKKLALYLTASLGIVAAITAAAEAAAYFLGEQVLVFIFGESIRPYAPLLYMAILSTAANTVLQCFATLLTSERKFREMMICYLICAGICAAVAYPLVSGYSVYGVTYVYIISQGVPALLMGIYSYYTIYRLPSEKTA